MACISCCRAFVHVTTLNAQNSKVSGYTVRYLFKNRYSDTYGTLEQDKIRDVL